MLTPNRHYDTTMTALIPILNQNKVVCHAVIDFDDFERLSKYNWLTQTSERGGMYARASIDGKMTFMHRFLMPDAAMVDHIDGNTLNNQKVNLRSITPSMNRANSRKSCNGKAKFKGVDFSHGLWRARIQINKKQISLGYYKTEQEAALAYNAKATELFGSFAKLNVV